MRARTAASLTERRRTERGTIALLAALFLALASLADPMRRSSSAAEPAGAARAESAERPYSVQMHLHALSNHNASDQPASMQWHTWFARESGVDVLWWSEHAEIFAMSDTFRLDLDDAVVDPRTLFVSGLRGSHVGSDGGRKRGVVGLAASSDGIARAEVRDSTLYLEAQRGGVESGRTSGRGGGAARLFVRPVTASGPVRLLSFARPITFGAIVEAEIDLGERDAQRIAEFRFPLSWHMYGKALRYEIRYRLAPQNEAPITTKIDEATVLVVMPCPSGRSTQWFDLEAAARLLRDGDDGTLSDIEWGVEARGSEPARIGVRYVRLWTKRSRAAANVQAARAIASRYEPQYAVRQQFGGEFAWGGTHLNAFYPDSSLSAERFQWTLPPLRPAEVEAWVTGVHGRGGITSLNHPFGTSFDAGARSSVALDDSEEPEGGDRADALTSGDAAVGSRTRALVVADRLFASRAFGCDILEVGYPRRGGATLDDHLALWDLLTANGCFLYANGTSDSHGGPWFGEHNPNWYVTWIWARDASAEALLEGARAGRIYFGDRSRWNGAFDVRLGPHRAGDRVAFQPADLDLHVTLDPVPPGAQVRVVRGALREPAGGIVMASASTDTSASATSPQSMLPVEAVEYVDRGTIIDLDAPGTLRIDGPCFVRFEVTIDAGMGAREPLLFSNPIVFY
jgi:hypothetical protein